LDLRRKKAANEIVPVESSAQQSTDVQNCKQASQPVANGFPKECHQISKWLPLPKSAG
jgi:hypothetical protein